MPLYFGWTETIGIRPNGEIVRWSTEGDYNGTRLVENQSWMLTALVAGADRYPELGSLLLIAGRMRSIAPAGPSHCASPAR